MHFDFDYNIYAQAVRFQSDFIYIQSIVFNSVWHGWAVLDDNFFPFFCLMRFQLQTEPRTPVVWAKGRLDDNIKLLFRARWLGFWLKITHVSLLFFDHMGICFKSWKIRSTNFKTPSSMIIAGQSPTTTSSESTSKFITTTFHDSTNKLSQPTLATTMVYTHQSWTILIKTFSSVYNTQNELVYTNT